MKEKIKIGISSCLLGEKTRFDGTHNGDQFINETLGKYVEFFSVCPEVEFGLHVPREPIRLEGNAENPRLITVQTKKDYTRSMLQWAQKRVLALGKEDLWGFIFKSHSPSCGLKGVKVHKENGGVAKKGVGVFARIFQEQFPLVPVEDEQGISAPENRKNFIEKVFAFQRWREFLEKNPRCKDLVGFHAQEKFLLLSHSLKHFRMMERLINQTGELSPNALFEKYQVFWGEAFSVKTTSKKNTGVLKGMAVELNAYQSNKEREELLENINRYAQGLIPLKDAITLINRYARRYNSGSLISQSFLNPSRLVLRLTDQI